MSMQVLGTLVSFPTEMPLIGPRNGVDAVPGGWVDRLLHAVGIFGVLLLIFGFLTIQPVAAQDSNPVCTDESDTLTNMIEGFIQLTTALGLVGLLVVWQAEELAEMFMLNQEQKRGLKEHKVNALKSASVLVVLGPVFTIAGRVMDLPIAQCVDLVPL